MKVDRRQNPRQSLASLIYLDLEPSNGGIVLDLSEGGMQISVANPLVGQGEIRFSLCLETRKRVHGSGQVAWISTSGRSAGVRFDSLPPETLRQIRECLSAPAEVINATIRECGPEPELSVPADEATASMADASVPTKQIADPEAQPQYVCDGDGHGEDKSPNRKRKEEIPEVARLDGEGPETSPVAAAGVVEGRIPSTDAQAAEKLEGTQESLTGQPQSVASVKQSGSASKKPSPPPWLEALIRAGRRDEFEEEVTYGNFWTTAQPEEDWQRTEESKEDSAEEAASAQEFQEVPPTPLYLPNYKLEEKPATGAGGTLKEKTELQMAAKLACERFEEFGWTLERDWHIWLALVLLLAGFLALAQNPPLAVLTGALWVASAMIALKRKQRPRRAEGAGPERQ